MHDKALQWKARRGLKELDIILQSFMAQHLSVLRKEEKAELEKLLELDDMTLLAYLTSSTSAVIPEKQQNIIRLIQKAHNPDES